MLALQTGPIRSPGSVRDFTAWTTEGLVRVRDGAGAGADDHRLVENLVLYVEVYLALIVKRGDVGIVRGQAFMPGPDSKVVKYRFRGNDSLLQACGEH